jgi:hypothetical protein
MGVVRGIMAMHVPRAMFMAAVFLMAVTMLGGFLADLSSLDSVKRERALREGRGEGSEHEPRRDAAQGRLSQRGLQPATSEYHEPGQEDQAEREQGFSRGHASVPAPTPAEPP